MKIILSPAKTFAKDLIERQQAPFYEKEAYQLIKMLKKTKSSILKKKMKLSDALLEEVTSFLADFGKKTYQAITTYEGQVFKQFGVRSLSFDERAYLNDHFFILSGLYGILKPDDGISLYRLEMKDHTLGNLYTFWQTKIADYLKPYKDEIFINLASDEYSKVLPSDIQMIHIDFIEVENNQDYRLSMRVKTMRGLFARYIVKHKITNPLDLKKIAIEGYLFNPKRSDESNYTFIKEVSL